MRNITTFVVSAAAVASAFAGSTASTTALDVSAGYHSSYIFRGIDFASEENSFADFGIDVSGECDCGLGWYAGLWNGRTSNGSAYNEMDVYAGVTKDLGFASIDFGAVTYTYDQDSVDGATALAVTADDTLGARLQNDSEIYLGLSTSAFGVDFGSTTYFGTGGDWKNGVWQQFTAGYGVDLNDTTSLGLELGAGFAYGQAGYGADVDGLASLSATVSLDKALSDDMGLGVYVSNIQNNEAWAGGADYTVAGVALSFSL